MRFDKIDIPKSKQKEKVIKKTWWMESILDFLAYLTLIGFYPFILGIFISNQLKKGDYLIIAIILFGLSLIVSGFLLYSIINIDRLKRVNGTIKEHNRQIIKALAEQLGWTLQTHNQQASIISPPWSWLSANWGREVTIIYDKQDILINSTSYGIHDLKSPFHWFGNRKLENTVIEIFEKEVKKLEAKND